METKIKTGRNDVCSCGSGKKYKNCCMNKNGHLNGHAPKWQESEPAQSLVHYENVGEENLANLAREAYLKGLKVEAVRSLREVITKNPRNAYACYILADIMRSEAAYSESLKMLNASIALWDGYKKKLLEKIEQGRDVIFFRKELDKTIMFLSFAYLDMGIIFYNNSIPDRALSCYQTALNFNPKLSQVYQNIAIILTEQNKLDEALESYKKAVELDPKNHVYIYSMATVHSYRQNFKESIRLTEEALKIAPDDLEAQINLAHYYYYFGDIEKAKKLAAKIIEKYDGRPEVDNLKVAINLMIPQIFFSKEHALKIREELLANLDKMIKDGVKFSSSSPLPYQFFYLAYHGFNNKDIQKKIANFYRKSCVDINFTAPHLINYKSKAKKRVGFISRYLSDHSVSRCYAEFIVATAKSGEVDVFAFSSSALIDNVSSKIQENCTYVVIPKSVPKCQELIAGYELDILIYLDIGMDPQYYYLAFARLANIQCVLQGHPDTTGVDTIDYFLSSSLMEPENAQEHYSEEFVGFNNIPLYYTKPPLPDRLMARSELGIKDDEHYYFCPMLLQKIHPDFDIAMAEILRKDKKGKIVLVEKSGRNNHEVLKQRFAATIPDVAERIIFIPHINDYTRFLSTLAAADAVLDTFQFGGGTTLYITFALGVPVVTLPGEFLRGRVGYSLYKKMGIMDLIAKDADDYANLAVKLASDKNFYDEIKSKILKNNCLIYETKDAVDEFVNFIKNK